RPAQRSVLTRPRPTSDIGGLSYHAPTRRLCRSSFRYQPHRWPRFPNRTFDAQTDEVSSKTDASKPAIGRRSNTILRRRVGHRANLAASAVRRPRRFFGLTPLSRLIAARRETPDLHKIEPRRAPPRGGARCGNVAEASNQARIGARIGRRLA